MLIEFCHSQIRQYNGTQMKMKQNPNTFCADSTSHRTHICWFIHFTFSLFISHFFFSFFTLVWFTECVFCLASHSYFDKKCWHPWEKEGEREACGESEGKTSSVTSIYNKSVKLDTIDTIETPFQLFHCGLFGTIFDKTLEFTNFVR